MRWCLLLLLAALPGCAQTWRTDLAYAGTDIWHGRLPVEIANAGAGDVAGQPVEIVADVLAGELADGLRVCDEAGAELLWDLRDAGGRRVASGPLPVGAKLIVPATVPAGGTQQLWLYFDNPTAYRVPDFLTAGARPANGGFELGEGTPDEWTFDGGDEQHALAVDTQVRHGGARSVRCDVAAGAQPTWIAARQLQRPVTPGVHYQLRAWVRGRDVVGSAGWYVHVATNENWQAINQVQRAGEGTFDWREVVIEFTAPPGAVTMSYGTVLYGTGTAWFDDFSVTSDAVEAPLRATVGPLQRFELARQSPPEPLPVTSRARLGAWVHNPGPALGRVLISLPVRRLLAALGGDATLAVVTPEGRTRAVERTGDTVLFEDDVPAAASREYAVVGHVELPERAGGPVDLVDSPANLAPNPSFEQGGALPEDWEGGTEGPQAAGVTTERVRGGRFGDWCLKLNVPPEAPTAWVGWRHTVEVHPHSQYVFYAHVRTEDVTAGEVRLHAHLFGGEGENRRYWSAGPPLTGTTDWTLLGGLIETGDADRLQMHLTMNARGTVYHDGVVLMRTVVARPGELVDPHDAEVQGLAVWVVDPVIKVFRDTPIGPSIEVVDLFAARGERESMQLCVRSDLAEAVTVSMSPLRGEGGTLPAPTIERVGYVPCLEPSGYHQVAVEPWERKVTHAAGRTDGWLGWWPDYLAPVTGPVPLEARRTQPIWLTFQIPTDAQPGVYTGDVTLRTPREGVTLPVSLKVWRFVQPERPSLQVIYDLRNGSGPRAFAGQDTIRAWWRFMAERRISSDHILPDPSFRLENGRVVMDTTAFDAAAALYFDELKMSAAYWPAVFYAAGWAYPPRDFLGTKYPSPEYNAAYSEAERLFQAHLRQRGWAERMFLYLSDEPHVWDREHGDDVRRQLGDVMKLIRAAAPEVRVYSSTWQHEPAWDGLLNHWGIAQYGGFPLDEMARRRAAGDLLWFTTDGQMEIDTPYCACERMLPWYCFAHDVSGYEFWGLTWYTYDPYQFGWHSYIQQSSGPTDEATWVRYPNGDGYLAYPGEPLGVAGPVPSIRLEQAREGIEEYELFGALARQRDPRAAAVLDQVRDLAFIPNAGGYRSTDILPDPSRLAAVRREAGELLDELLR